MSSTYSLAVVEGNATGTRIDILGRTFDVGRSAGSQGGLGGDPAISRHHARFTVTHDGGLMLEDLGSTNGTFVNGDRVTGPRALQPGDVIEVGETVLEVSSDDLEATASYRHAVGTTGSRGGAAVGGNVYADRGSIGAIGELRGNLDMSSRYEYDASGLGLITRSRGAARFLLILGTLIGFAGFGLFGYPIVNGIITAASNTSASDAALDECDNRYPHGGFAWAECQQKASRSAGSDFPSLTPWLPTGAALFFGGMVISAVGLFMIRHER